MTVQETKAARRKRGGGEPEAYDFRRPMTLVREHGRVLEMAFETYARQWGTQLTSRLRVVAQATLESVEMRSYDDYVGALPSMTTMVLCSVEPGRATGVLQLPLETTMLWIDYLLGGPGLVMDTPVRELTEIEWDLTRDLLHYSLRDLNYAFAAVTPLDVAVRSVQYNPQFVQVVGASEPVIVASFDLNIAGRSSHASLMFPADVLLASLRAGEQPQSRSAEEVRENEESLARIADQVNEVPVSVSVRFAPLTVRPSDITELEIGDVLSLRHHADTPLDVVVGDVVLARAAIGTNGSQLACIVVTSEENS